MEQNIFIFLFFLLLKIKGFRNNIKVMEEQMINKFRKICNYYDQQNKGYLTTTQARSLIKDFFKFFPLALKHKNNKNKIKLMVQNIFDIVTEFNKNTKEVKINLVVRIFILL